MRQSSKIIYATLVLSIAIHIVLLMSNLFTQKAVTETKLKPVTVTLQTYTLAEPKPSTSVAKTQPTQPESVKKAKTVSTLTSKKEAHAKIHTPASTSSQGILSLPIDTIKPTGPTQLTAKQKYQAAAANSPQESILTDESPFLDKPPTDQAMEVKQPAAGKLTQADIANNGNIIAPKGKQTPPFPKIAHLRYQGPASVTGTMDFRRSNNSYQVNAQFNIPFYKIELSSSGSLQGDQFVPEKFTDKRKGKPYSQVIFDYQNQQVLYGKASEDIKAEPMMGIPQDYLSLAWQLAIKGGKINQATQLTSGKTLYVRNNFEVEGAKELDTNEGKIQVQVFKIDKGEDSIEFAFAQDFANVPAQVVLYQKGKRYELNLIEITMDGVDYWQAVRRSTALKNR